MQVIEFRGKKFEASKEQLDAIKFVIDVIGEVANESFETSKEDTRDTSMTWRAVARALGFTDGIEYCKDYIAQWDLYVSDLLRHDADEG